VLGSSAITPAAAAVNRHRKDKNLSYCKTGRVSGHCAFKVIQGHQL